MSRISIRDFSKYLYLSPPADQIPASALRRARGVHPVKTLSLRSRPGAVQVNALPAKSIFIYRSTLYTFTGTSLYAGASLVQSLSADSLSFLSFPPIASKKDWLFISNGGALYKADPTHVISQWGITPPPDGFTATASAASTRAIDLMESTVGTRWTSTNCTDTADTANFMEGAQSLKLTVASNRLGSTVQNTTLDLSTMSDSSISTGADYITFNLMIDYPKRVDSIQIIFSLGNTTFTNNKFSFTCYRETAVDDDVNKESFNTYLGLGSWSTFAITPNDEIASLLNLSKQNNNYWKNDTRYVKAARDHFQSVNLPDRQTDIWKEMRIAKSSFQRSGKGAFTWADVQAVKVKIQTNTLGTAIVNIDEFQLEGKAGMQGDYTYYITYLNSNSGSRSNPNPTAVVIDNNKRQQAVLANLPVPTDPQVTHVEIWRTVGDGSIPFYCGAVTAGTTTFTDNVADCYLLDPRSGAVYLGADKLLFTNTAPFTTFGYCVGWQATIFWTNSADENNAGNLYYSRTGYSETVEGFIRLSTSNDPAQRPIIWNGVLYAFTASHVFQVQGSNPYVFREVFGVSGSPCPATICPTPYGIMYQALDGIRLFNGTRSERAGWPQMGKLFSGENAENLSSFIGTCATWGRNEYFISDGSQTMVYNITDDTWRDLGLGFDCLYTDPLTGIVYGGNSTGVYQLEIPGTLTDAGTPIPFSVQTKTVLMDADREIMVNHLFLDANTAGQGLTVTLITEKGEISIGVLTTPSRRTEVIPINKACCSMGIRLEGSLTAPVEIFGIEVDADVSQDTLHGK